MSLVDPLDPLGRVFGDLATPIHVVGKLCSQDRVGSGDFRRGMASEITGDRSVELASRRCDGLESGSFRGLQVFGNRTVEGNESLDHGARAAGERFVLGLHDSHGLHGIESRSLDEHVSEQDDRSDGGQAERQPRTDSETQSSRLRPSGRRLVGARRQGAVSRVSGGFVHTT